MVADAKADLLVQADATADQTGLLARYPGAVAIDRTGKAGPVTEMDALVAYLQMLGTLVKFRDLGPAELQQ
jgi:cytochrome c oxidase cbb3-type subunit 2